MHGAVLALTVTDEGDSSDHDYEQEYAYDDASDGSNAEVGGVVVRGFGQGRGIDYVDDGCRKHRVIKTQYLARVWSLQTASFQRHES